MTTSVDKAIHIFRQHHSMLHTKQAIQLGVAPRTLYAMRDSGQIVELSRGVFRLADAPMLTNIDLVQVVLRIPRGVVCLVSALSFYNLTTQIPHQIDVALPQDAEKPRLLYPPLRLFWLSPAVYNGGITETVLDGVTAHIYNREKTVADCFKFRNKIGLDIAIESLKEGVAQGISIEMLMKYAHLDRVEKIILPYLEALM